MRRGLRAFRVDGCFSILLKLYEITEPKGIGTRVIMIERALESAASISSRFAGLSFASCTYLC